MYPYCGLLTGSASTILGTSNTLLTLYYYNDEGSPSNVYKQHYQSGSVNADNCDEVIITRNFEGIITVSNRIHHNSGTGNTTIATRYDYDHLNRPLRTYIKINNDSEVKLAENSYNEIVQLKRRSLHNGLQNSKYAYNERGWVKNSISDQFSFQLKYNNGATPQYNGDISEQLWGKLNTR